METWTAVCTAEVGSSVKEAEKHTNFQLKQLVPKLNVCEFTKLLKNTSVSCKGELL